MTRMTPKTEPKTEKATTPRLGLVCITHTDEVRCGKGGRSERLIEQIGLLPDGVRSRIAFENDEYIYSAAEILDVCRRAGVPWIEVEAKHKELAIERLRADWL